MRVDLDQEEWNRVLTILASAAWSVANPLILKIGEQLQRQQPRPNGPVDEADPTVRRPQ